ncbi:Protein CBG06985 [Caenorhabditis briggsae]|uniref:PDZ domain-containing protein n=2 Tax=Caenorhabditis briggsae TaxID=6238 RepID=A0AAE9DQ93_CAEBR|nr:Protein CBG06985 [Caenorhabditis briggsae]ULU09048.1 hypothetical protein L3Y34_019916 [Caenorhabditis briggsae]UMM20943.1 hypothetical protein L5515_016006 [Caenorhabditis briggsae]CAP27356.1 Protein CBG06985 [Caenorhabditis briggsae]
MSNPASSSASSKCKSAENTDDDRTLAEDDQIDQNSGSMDHRFERVTVTLEKVVGKKFGLGIVSVHQRILVCKVENDSLVSGVLRYGDQIMEINKKEVLNKIDCKKRLMSCLKDKGHVEILLMRPKTPDAVKMIEQEIQLSQQPSSTVQSKQ